MDKLTATRHLHWGKPPSNYREWTTTTICCHRFATLPTKRGVSAKSPEFTSLDHRWYLEVYPGGDEDGADDSVALFLWSNETGGRRRMCIEFAFAVRDGTGGGGGVVNTLHGSSDGDVDVGLGGDFASRSKILDSLVDGTLVIEVRMRHAGTTAAVAFVPDNPSSSVLGGLFLDGTTSDVVFGVTKLARTSNDNSTETATTVEFPAHRLIVERYVNKLADLCRALSGGGEDTTPTASMVHIDDVSPDVFRHLLHYMYGGKVFENGDGDVISRAREIYEAADAYGMIELKLEAEAYYVNYAIVSVDNVVELLTFADEKKCDLLKERVMDYIVTNKVEVLARLSLEDVPGVLFSDLLAAVARVDGTTSCREEEDEQSYPFMGIGELRRMAHERGLSIDGSRASLISALKAPPGRATAPVAERGGAVDDSSEGGGGAGGKGGFLMRLLASNATLVTTGGGGGRGVDVPRDDNVLSSAPSHQLGSGRDP
ncbi:hypothetical protein ACHAXA_007534 [Cyclostephanos tholiformis]|uniref:BTB domain-containing protein n=1 Tax=Cyclostephanos tholiformis TaxID=382380 RepID=A0ABD3SR01_9STRA